MFIVFIDIAKTKATTLKAKTKAIGPEAICPEAKATTLKTKALGPEVIGPEAKARAEIKIHSTCDNLTRYAMN